jgi:YVTN family beta-propeller protein
MPLGGALSPDGRFVVIANAGFGAHAVHVLDVASEQRVARLPVVRAWGGAAWSPAGDCFYVSGGIGNPQNDIYRFTRTGDEWTRSEGIKLEGPRIGSVCVSWIGVSRDGRTLYAANLSDHRLYVLDTETGQTLGRIEVGTHPVAGALGKDGSVLYLALWGGAEVVQVALKEARSPEVRARWKVGSHPNALALHPDGRLFVSCGNDDTVDVIDTAAGVRIERIRTALRPAGPLGSTPNAVTIAGDRLYVANADNNNVCVVDIGNRARSRVLGFIPTGWYPSAVLAVDGGRRILIGSGKGTGTRPNPARLPINPIVPAGFEYIGQQLTGLLSFVTAPDERQLRAYTQQVIALTPDGGAALRKVRRPGRSPIPSRPGSKSPIRYVLYIIKENRTYDQVFGDIRKGNGDPNLCLFGEEVTPNQHALADEFVLLDNLYCTGEVSEDGHPWSTMAYATDHTQRSWILHYSGKGSLPDQADMGDSSAGFIWEACKAHGISFRSYGEYAGHKSLEGHHSLAYVGKAGPGAAPPGRDTERADIFIKEFREFERKGTMPRFMVMSLGENHTNGTKPGSFTPKAMVASNDLALGRIVEAVSHSSLWPQFAIFVIEDDAQNGPDHVDSHRTVGLVISPYVRRRSVDSNMYSTSSMLRTMELILGLPPLTQHDASATPMHACFTDKPDLRPYRALPARIDLNARNVATAYGAQQSALMDWSEYDRINEDELNRILWHSIKGAHVPYPAPVRTALIGRK